MKQLCRCLPAAEHKTTQSLSNWLIHKHTHPGCSSKICPQLFIFLLDNLTISSINIQKNQTKLTK